MNETLQVLLNRKSIREYEPRPIEPEVKRAILAATLRAPTAGNLMMYSIIDITDQAIKDALAESCDHQPFIATAPMLWLFVADYQRWWDTWRVSNTDKICQQRGITPRPLQEGDLLLAAVDTVIAAQTAVIAAESLGVGSCYIGDILEKYEFHRDLFNLPDYALPIALICFGYATPEQQARVQTSRFDQRFVVFENCYQRLSADDFADMYRVQEAQFQARKNKPADLENFGQAVYFRKFAADYSIEMSRSVRAMVNTWLGNPPQ